MTTESANSAKVIESKIGRTDLPKLSIRPYPGDDVLAVIYLQAKAEGLIGAFFWEEAPTLIAFLQWCNRHDAVPVACYYGEFIAGLGVMSGIKTRAGKKIGDVSQLFFKQYQALGVSPKFGQMLLDYVFEEIKADCAYGTTPSKNAAAIHYMHKAGFTHLPPMPMICAWNGESSDGVFSYLTKEAWANLKMDRRDGLRGKDSEKQQP